MDKWPQDYPQDGWTDYRHYVTPRSLNDWNANEAHDTFWSWVKGVAIACVLFIVLLYGAR